MRHQKKTRSVTAVLLAALLAVSGFPMMAFANEAKTGEVEVESAAGVLEKVVVAISKTTASGIATTSSTAKDYVTDSGMTVSYQSELREYDDSAVMVQEEENVHYTSVNSDKTYEAEGGSERTIAHRAPSVTLEIPLTADDQATAEENEGIRSALGAEVGTSDPDGDKKTSDDDGVYDYVVTTIQKQGQAAVETVYSDVFSMATFDGTDPMTYVNNETSPTQENGLLMGLSSVTVPDDLEIARGYGFQYLGYDKHSSYFAAFGYTDPSLGMKNEQPIVIDDELSVYVNYDHGSMKKKGFAVGKAYLPDRTVTAEEGSPFPARWASVQQFVLSDRNGNTITTYCADQTTNAHRGYNYNMRNLVDADYYETSDAEMIRAIAFKGYWGAQEGFGSLESVKQLMRDSGEFSEEQIEKLTDGMALTATQFAVWTYANRAHSRAYFNVYQSLIEDCGDSHSSVSEEEADLIFGLYRLLVNLDPSTIDTKTTQNTIINADHFLDSVSMSITGMPVDHPNNQDDDASNDVYTVDLTFDLEVLTDVQRDSLVLAVYDGQEETPMAIGRIAGSPRWGEQMISPNEDETFTLSGVNLVEGGESVRIAMTGSQMLAKDAYLFSSEIKEGVSSQTMVGIAEGQHEVNVMMALDFDFEVDNETANIERLWRTEKTITPGSGEPGEPAPSPNDGQPETLAPTGDNLMLWAVAGLAAISLSIACLLVARGCTNRRY